MSHNIMAPLEELKFAVTEHSDVKILLYLWLEFYFKVTNISFSNKHADFNLF